MYGKLFGLIAGGSVGMLLAWSPGLATALAVAGAVIGHFAFDREAEQPRVLRAEWRNLERRHDTPVDSVPVGATTEQALLLDAMCPLFIELARVDAPVAQIEVRVIREFFEHDQHFSPGAMEAVRLALKRALESAPRPFDESVTHARACLAPALRPTVVRWLYELALADGALTNSETVALKRIVERFELSEAQLRDVTKQFFGDGAAHFSALGLTAAATDDDIRAAFRRLAAEHHPDKAAWLSPEQAAQSARRFHEVKEAYEALKRLRGF